MRPRFHADTKKRLWHNIVVTIGILIITVILGEFLYFLGLENQNLIMLYNLSILIIALRTDGYLYGTLAAVAETFIFDYLVTEPRVGFSITIGFPITLLFMLTVSLISCTVTTRMKTSFAQQQVIRIDAEKEKTRGTLLRAISHDLRTPLTGIFSASSIIEEQADTLAVSDVRQFASDIKHNSEWLIRMVENLLVVTRISEGDVKIKKTVEVAEEIMAQAVSIVRKRFPECVIIVKAPDEAILVCVDPILISQVFINLLENAVKYSPQGSPVQFNFYKNKGFAQFEVSDKGRGISTQIIDHLFEAYSQKQEYSADAGSGMGIGLSICKTIIDAHDGKITGDNKLDGGALFNVMLPLNEG